MQRPCDLKKASSPAYDIDCEEEHVMNLNFSLSNPPLRLKGY